MITKRPHITEANLVPSHVQRAIRNEVATRLSNNASAIKVAATKQDRFNLRDVFAKFAWDCRHSDDNQEWK